MRRFTAKQRRYLYILAGGFCRCGKRLDSRFHADHVVPYIAGGPTVLANGRALCRDCNLKKGAAHGDASRGPGRSEQGKVARGWNAVAQEMAA